MKKYQKLVNFSLNKIGIFYKGFFVENISKPSALDNINNKKSYSKLIFHQKCNIKMSNFTKGYTNNFLNTRQNISKPSALDNIYDKKSYS